MAEVKDVVANSVASNLQDDVCQVLRVFATVLGVWSSDKLVLQAVHCMYNADFSGTWEAEETRSSKLVIIGKGLAKDELRAQFEACRASPLGGTISAAGSARPVAGYSGHPRGRVPLRNCKVHPASRLG